MPQAEAYCEEHERNITLDEAHILFFKQEEGKRRRFNFRCGDPRCRAMNQPKVVAALYDRKEMSGAKLRSPYYREHSKHKHIVNCTWKNDAIRPQTDMEADPADVKPSTPVMEDLGLILKLKRRKPSAGKEPSDIRPSDDDCDNDDDEPKQKEEGRIARAPTSQFMATVATRYLRYTEHERKSINLTIEGVRTGPFYNVCIPMQGFHPHYQTQQIYQGRVIIAELTNVFIVRFLAKMSPTGEKDKRVTVAEIKLLKRWLDENDRALGAILHEIAAFKTVAWCFFYTTKPVIQKDEKAQFVIDEATHIAIIDEAEIEILSPVTE